MKRIRRKTAYKPNRPEEQIIKQSENKLCLNISDNFPHFQPVLPEFLHKFHVAQMLMSILVKYKTPGIKAQGVTYLSEPYYFLRREDGRISKAFSTDNTTLNHPNPAIYPAITSDG